MAKTKGSFQRASIKVTTPEEALSRMREGADVRADYARYRKIANERLRKMEKAGMTNLDVYRSNKNRFPTLIEIGSGSGMDKRLLADAMSEITRFLNYKATTPAGYRETLQKLQSKFESHYVGPNTPDNLPPMPPELFGEMMRAIKDHANAEAYYRNWRKAYRTLLGNADRAGLSPEELTDAVKNGEIQIGVKGGLLDESTGRYITRKWSGME